MFCIIAIWLYYYLVYTTTCSGINIQSASYVRNTLCGNMVLAAEFTYSTAPSASNLRCAFRCSREDACLSFHFVKTSRTCHLNTHTSTQDCANMITNVDATHFDKLRPVLCLNGGNDVNGTCICVDGFVGTRCERLMEDCSEGISHGYPSGIYNIQPPYITTSFPVVCLMRFGGRTIIQSRVNAQIDFYRNWTDYRDGFGSMPSDFWIGLEKIYQITRNRSFELRFYMSLQNRTYYQQRYYDFHLSNEQDGYEFSYSSSAFGGGGRLYDSLLSVNGSKFSTRDVDNDNWENGSCAQRFQSGFWFNACADANPNGRLLQPSDGKRTNVDYEIFWTYNLADNAPFKVYMWLLPQ